MLHVFIINMNAGKNNSYPIGKIINEYCKSKNVDFSIHYVINKEDTAKIINKYKKCDNTTIYSVGGDGTLNQVINCIANTDLKLNVIPAGTGNDFYRSLENYNGNRVDLGKVNDNYFINVASVGIDAEMANTANKLKKTNISSDLVYPISIFKNFFTFKPIKLDVNGAHQISTLVTVCNGNFYGGGFNISPISRLNDGLLDVYEIGNENKLQILKIFLQLLKGKHINNSKVKLYKTDKISINSPIVLNCNIDGEIIRGKNFDFKIEKNAINLDNDELKIRKMLRDKRIIK